jgi:hypothetical protein
MPAAALDGLFAGGGTITAMIRPSGWGSNGHGLVVGRADEFNGDGGWVLQVDAGTDGLRFARGFTTNRRTWYAPAQSLSLHAWHHVAVVYQDDPDGAPAIYIDGASLAVDEQGSGMGTPTPDEAPELHIGGEPSSYQQSFNGMIDELRLAPRRRSGAWMTVELSVMRDELASYGPPQSSPCS